MEKSLIARTWSGVIFAAVILGVVCWSPKWLAGVLFTLLTLATMREFYAVWLSTAHRRVVLCMAAALCLLALVFGVTHLGWPLFRLAFIVPFLPVLMISTLYAHDAQPLAVAATAFWGFLYVAVPFAFLIHISGMPHASELLAGFFLLLWVNDSGAYLTGVTFGKHRLMESVSPKKSWEGLWGGALLTVASALVMMRFMPGLPGSWWAAALLVVALGVYGDLFESLLKRSLGVKDSGRFMPGHGGLLDRFDSLLAAAPVFWLYLMIALG